MSVHSVQRLELELFNRSPRLYYLMHVMEAAPEYKRGIWDLLSADDRAALVEFAKARKANGD